MERPGAADGGRLLGRMAERTRLAELVDTVASGRPDALLIMGEAGIGKTAIADQALASAEAAGMRVARGRGVPLTIEQPLQPVLEALHRLGVDMGGGGARTLLEATVSDPVSLLLQRAIHKLEEVAASGPVVIVLEDMHWADRATLTVIHHLSGRTSRAPLGIIATARPAGPGTPLHHLTVGLGSDVLQLGGLGADEIDQLGSRMIGRPLGSSVQALLAGGGGNPMLVEALVDGLISSGGLGADPDVAELTASPVLTPGGPVVAQVEALAAGALHLVQLSALIVDTVRVDLLVRLTGRRLVDILDDLEGAVSAGVLRRDDGEFAFRHDLHRAAALESLPLTAQAALHLDIARELEALGAPSLDVAEHLARGARPGNRTAVAQLTDTAEEVVGHLPATALRVTDLALALVGQPEVPTALQVVRVAAMAACGQAAEADLVGNALLRTSLPAPVEARLRRDLALAAFVDGRAAEATAHMTRVADIAPDPAAAAKARTELAWTQFLGLEHHAAAEGAMVGVAKGDDATRISALALKAWVDLWHLDIADAHAAAVEVGALAARTPLGEWQVFQPHLAAAAVFMEEGLLDESRQAVTRGRQLAVESGSAWAAPAYDAMSAAIDLRTGDIAAATEKATAALEGTAVVDGFGVEVWSRSQLARLAMLRGDEPMAEHHVAAATFVAAEGRAQLGLEQLLLATAELAGLQGDVKRAHESLVNGWTLLSLGGATYLLSTVGAALVRSAVAIGDDSMAATVAATVADHARRSGLPAAQVDAARAAAWHEPSSAAWDSAIATARTTGWPLLELEALSDAAASLRPTDAARAADYAAAGGELAGRLGLSEPRPERRRARRVRPTFGRESLTDAEQRVATLVTEGLTNAEIAAQLIVSRRTVDSQVLAAYRKLGVSSRVELTRALLIDQPS